ncbi:hypothetical protein NA56DRAFT_640571 [Hyaloscypha hepaticicola]|uniref:S-adenosyl-L-methionine-dependent methyltransferase n=1 Tax=Hyaloscypha hepaticicola TaxID=2082293 RepID=A0A2J6QNH2_9HELO|nr:hypothetical protein NA56DRAFT_640571 [Hyaloscypha hepaticicola]
MLLPLFNQFKSLASKSSSRIPIIIAVVVLIFLTAVWHGRSSMTDHPLGYVKGAFAPRPSFYDIATKYGTDKVTVHTYHRMYEHRLAPLRDQKIKMLEIGLGCDMGYGPGASYYTWLEYFPHVDLYYIEYDAECAHRWANKTDKATIFTGDQADVDFLTQFMLNVGGNFDVIIDDGGHTMNQQKISLRTLWPAIKPGGIYFIEDLATSYLAGYGGGAIGSDTMMNDLKIMLDDINRPPNVPITFPKVSNQVVSFEFTQEVVALTKFS